MGLLTGKIIGAAIAVHQELGPGLLESAYRSCLAYALQQAGLKLEMEKPLPIIFQGVRLDCGYRIDLLVENEVIVEVKAVESLHAIHQAQLLSYLKLSGRKIGLLINFHEYRLADGIKRLIHSH